MSSIPPQRQKQLQKLLQKLGLPEGVLANWSLLDLALTHSSACASANYEKLEFVGDAAIRLAAAEFLWQTYPNFEVGEFAAIRSVLVSDRILAQIARSYGLERYLLVAGSATGDKAGMASRLADALEAIAAALYLSTYTLELVRPWLDSHFQTLTEEIRACPARQNYKAALQEWTQAQYKLLPEYRVVEINPIHGSSERFSAEVWLQNRCLGKGKGRSIKTAEQEAARTAFQTATGESSEFGSRNLQL
ncbi:ribonuclease III [Oscillatoriales cyanobacterium LEGE 11467]|uniref:Ribonuclease 3 n=1 Tax=Zarconia navalis LEGE 11467 TaxID=1828826 RepID=A0A928Z7U6_9CYAN|nr:ribonuclease III [Zarconia navalis]MBE9040900.1 ribonuclease III [Zarconia navalis LEGE 11467]